MGALEYLAILLYQNIKEVNHMEAGRGGGGGVGVGGGGSFTCCHITQPASLILVHLYNNI